MNSISISGTVTRDAELKSLNSGDSILSFSIADNQAGRDKPAIFWNCTLFGKRADSLSQYITRGQSVTVVGSVSEREWQDKEGNKRKSMDVRVNDIALQGGRKDAEPQQERQTPKPQSSFDDDDGSDVPF